jgi:hypothetical protein
MTYSAVFGAIFTERGKKEALFQLGLVTLSKKSLSVSLLFDETVTIDS